MTNRLISIFAIGAISLLAAPTTAQEVDEEIRRAAQAAASAAVSQAISDTVVTPFFAKAGDEAAASRTTLWTRPQFLSLTGDGPGVRTETDVVLLPMGVVHQVTDEMLVNASVTASRSSTDVGGAFPSDFDSTGLTFGAGATYIAYRTPDTAFRFDLLTTYSHTFLDSDDLDVLAVTPSATATFVWGPIAVEPSLSVPVSIVLDSDADDRVTPAIGGGLRVLAELNEDRLLPEIRMSLSRSLDDDAEGVNFSVSPELNHVIGNMTFGAGYAYQTTLGGDSDIDIEGHSLFLNFRLKI